MFAAAARFLNEFGWRLRLRRVRAAARMANLKLAPYSVMTVFSRAMTALCGPAQPELQDFRDMLASAGLRANVFVPDVPNLDRRVVRACQLAAKQGYVLTDLQGNLRGRLVPHAGPRRTKTA
jgi:hypothetical protein